MKRGSVMRVAECAATYAMRGKAANQVYGAVRAEQNVVASGRRGRGRDFSPHKLEQPSACVPLKPVPTDACSERSLTSLTITR
jgi:hypothetical protein